MNTHKILVVLIMGILIASTTGGFLGAGENTLNNTDGIISKTEEHKISLSKPIFTDAGEFINVAIEEQTSYLMDEGKPMLPVFTKIYTFPLGTTINNVNVQINQDSYTIDKKVEPSPEPVLLTLTDEEVNSVENNYDENQYDNLDIYPSTTYEINTGAGLDGEEHVLILNIKCYTQYEPAENKIYVPNEIIINLDYNLPPEPLFNNDAYDLLIITHDKFEADLQPLVDHKNNIGIKTKMTTVDEIYSQYNGVADWEKIKLYIFDAIKNWGITYVLLAGGHKGQTYEWYVPDFRSNNYDDSDLTDRDAIMDLTYSSDLYFSDVLFADQYGKPAFSNWDSNGNGIYAEGPYYDSYDIIDFYPDVYVGRIPLIYSWETPIVVDKIINYETNSDKSWFNNAVLVAGDTSPPARGSVDPGVYEGELAANVAAGYLKQAGFTTEKLYTSTGTFASGQDIINAVENGCGYVTFDGHGNPALWGNFLPDAPTEADFVYGFTIFDIKDYNNGDKLPFMVIDGCHNAQFDVTMQHVVEYGGMGYPGNYWLDWSPHDGCSWFVLQEGGGAIATIGNTALGYGYINDYATEGLGGWIMPRIAYQYSKGIRALGELVGQTITDYIDNFPVQTDMVDRKTIDERALIGDPSLKLADVNPSLSGPNEDNDKETPVSFSGIDVPVWQVGDTWTYNLDNIDLSIHETEGRDIDVKLNADDFTLTVTDVQSDTFITEFSTSNANIQADIYFDQYVEGKTPINTSITLKNVDLTGQIIFTKASLAIKSVDLNINLDIIENLAGLPIQFDFPPFIEKLLTKIKLPANIQVNIGFDPAFTFIDFPLETGKSWGMPATALTIRIDGEINSIWLRLANLFNKIFHFIPEDFAKYLPVIDIGDILEDYGIPSLINMDLPAMEKFFRKPLFQATTLQTVTVPAGTYDSYQTLFAQGLGEIYYSPEAENFVKLSAAMYQYCPIIQNIDLELKSTNQ